VGRHPFDSLMELHTDDIRLDCAALHLARDAYADINIPHYLRILDGLAEEIACRRPGLSATLRFRAMRDVLVRSFELRGDTGDYGNPENAYLNRVLDRRLGVPITLSAIWIEVGRRLKWPVSGIALPGHFLVRFDDRERFVLADPFAEGQTLSADDCKRIVEDHFDEPVRFTPKMLNAVDTRTILARLLKNLRRIYLARGDWPRLARVLRRLVAVEPLAGQHLQDLACAYARCGDVRGAYSCLRAYLRRIPNARDGDIVQWNLNQLEAALLARN